MKQYLSKHKIKLKTLIKKKINKAGRNNSGKITVYHRGGGHKRLLRKINFKLPKKEGIIVNIEYDPNRTAFIAKVCYIENNTKKYFYMLAPKNIKPLDTISIDQNPLVLSKIGHTYKMHKFNVGDNIYNIELIPNKGGQLVRSAGTYAEVLKQTSNFTTIKLPSGEHRMIPNDCTATFGFIANENHKNINIGKAGKSRWLNKRPVVRGVAMNPVDHPHGGGEGKSSGGRPSVTPWGKYTKGQPTRSKKKKII